MKRSLSILVGVLAGSSSLWADTLTLKNGAELHGVVTERSAEGLTLRIEGGEIRLPASMIGSVETGSLTLEALESQERKAQPALSAASQERRSKVLRDLESQEQERMRARDAQPVPAAFTAENRSRLDASAEESLPDRSSEIAAKLELLRALLPELPKTGFPEQERLRDAVLSDLFPNYRSPAMVW